MNIDTLAVLLSDTHSGSSTSLFPALSLWKFDLERNHTPTENQKRIYKHWLRCAAEAARLRVGKRMIVVLDGDAIEGWHHRTLQVVTTRPEEQKKIHLYLMRQFLKRCGFDPAAGDKLVYVKGTEIHTGETEMEIAAELGAEYKIAHDFVEMEINGRLVWFAHQGPGSSDGPNAGDSARLWLKRIYWDMVHRRRRVPDLIVTGHFHRAVYNNYVQMRDGAVQNLRGVVLPSWQMKTRHVYAKAPATVNEIGAAFVSISAEGVISDPAFMLMQAPNGVYMTL
jgi:hypothetical protein